MPSRKLHSSSASGWKKMHWIENYGKLRLKGGIQEFKMTMTIKFTLFFSCVCSFPLQFEVKVYTCFNSYKNLKLKYLYKQKKTKVGIFFISYTDYLAKYMWIPSTCYSGDRVLKQFQFEIRVPTLPYFHLMLLS